MGLAAKQYVQQICPMGSKVKVDEDDGQTGGSHGRIVGVVYCNGVNLNEAVIEKGFGHLSFTYCDNSEFSDKAWSGCVHLNKLHHLNHNTLTPQVTVIQITLGNAFQ